MYESILGEVGEVQAVTPNALFQKVVFLGSPLKTL